MGRKTLICLPALVSRPSIVVNIALFATGPSHLKGEQVSDPRKRLSAVGQAHLISGIDILFGNDEHLLLHMFSHKEAILRRPAKNLINEAGRFKTMDQALLRCGLDFWNQRGAARLADMIASFTHKEWTQFVLAVCHLEEIKADVHEALARDL
jgi:hypothetical protein